MQIRDGSFNCYMLQHTAAAVTAMAIILMIKQKFTLINSRKERQRQNTMTTTVTYFVHFIFISADDDDVD